ncbi:TPA: nitrilase-related carbon-nitrogen hydrolase [Clostridioides difficile]
MSKENKNVRIAVVQASPVIMDLEKTVEKALGLIKEAGRKGGKYRSFP